MSKSPYLERKFIEELNEEGIIQIRGYEFFRDKILSEFEPEGYKIAFNDWKEERRQRLLELADNILNSFDNKDRFQRLRELYKRDMIIPFVGAGLSIPSGLPSWVNFLEKVCQEIDVNVEEFNQLTSTGKFEEAAELLEQNDHRYLQEQLDNIFGKDFEFNKIDGVICRLPEFFDKSSLVTTNYDNLIKIIYENSELHFSEYLSGLEHSVYSRHIREGKRVLLKLHGTYHSKRQRILTTSDYNKHYDENNDFKECIEALFNQSMVFLGCSLSVDRVISELTKIVLSKDQDSLPKHYAFLSYQNLEENDRKKKRMLLNKANIYPIWYEGDHDECIEALLEKLAEE